MDEILYSRRRKVSAITLPGFAPDKSNEIAVPERILKRLRLFLVSLWILAVDLLEVGAIKTGRRVSREYHTIAAHVSRYKPGRLNYLLITSAVGLVLVVSMLFRVSLEVKIDGETIGAVKNQSEFESVLDKIEAQTSKILGYEYAFAPQVGYEFAITSREAVLNDSELQTILFSRIGEVMKAYVIAVDGTAIGASQSRADLNNILDGVLNKYRTQNTITALFVQNVSIGYQYAAADIAQDLTEIRSELNSNAIGQVTYCVQGGDTLSGIAYDHDMSLSELTAMNPGVQAEKLQIGSQLIVSQPIPTISVKTVEKATYTEAVPFEVEKVEEASLYVGESKIVKAGINGQAQVTANITMINGAEQSREILSSVVMSEPVTQLVSIGTKQRPKTAPTGTFAWPTSGRITSKFGYRTLMGIYGFHEGIDIANSYGTSIKASDGGTVTYAGWRGNYGYLVIISHGKGVETRYGHCSSLLVSVGDKVYKGEKIAKMGSTGRSTGNHCHFEIRINGTPVNPLSYLN